MERPEFEFPPWLNKKFVGSVLRDNAENKSIVVKDVKFTTAGGRRGKYGSDFHRVTVTYKTTASEDNTRHLIVKSLSTNEQARKFLEHWKYFEKEVHVYEVVLPAMYALSPRVASKRLPPADPLPLAPLYYRSHRPRTVVMTDMTHEGYKLCTKKQGLDHDHAKLALEAMAKFHALSLAVGKKSPETLEMFREKFFVEGNREHIKLLVDQPFIDLPNEVATWPGYEHFADRIRAVPVIDRVIEAMSVKEGTVAVLNHGDFWTSNIMFKYNQNGEAECVKLVDFQQCRLASPALDIIYFMFSTPSEVVRDSFWDSFLDIYHKTFSQTLKLANCDPGVLSVEQLTHDIQDKMFFGLLVACTLLPLTLAALENTPLEGKEAYAGPRFKKAFQKLLAFFDKRGIL